MNKILTEMPWVIFKLMDEQFAFSARYVKEMVAMPKVVAMPQSPDHIRGVINLRGKVMPVMDLRLKMGIDSLIAETQSLIDLLNQREQDHKNWMVELEASVREKREFKLATDPHKCAFGIWYDNFETENRILDTCLKKFDTPHKKIHGIAIEVKKMEEKEDFDSAYNIINRTREHELAEMINLFEEARTLLVESNREIALVLEYEERTMVVSVDSVTSVEKHSMDSIEDMPETTFTLANDCIDGIGRRGDGNQLFQILNVEKLLSAEDNTIDKTQNISL